MRALGTQTKCVSIRQGTQVSWLSMNKKKVVKYFDAAIQQLCLHIAVAGYIHILSLSQSVLNVFYRNEVLL